MQWNKDQWEVNGSADPHLPNRFFIHPDSPASGEKWMQYPLSFHKLKLTNNTLNSSGLVRIHLYTFKTLWKELHIWFWVKALLDKYLHYDDIPFCVHQVVLHSMHKYQPRLHIVQSPDPSNPHMHGGYLRFTFPEAAFIAVTAYQNQEVKIYATHVKCSLDMSNLFCLLKKAFWRNSTAIQWLMWEHMLLIHKNKTLCSTC